MPLAFFSALQRGEQFSSRNAQPLGYAEKAHRRGVTLPTLKFAYVVLIDARPVSQLFLAQPFFEPVSQNISSNNLARVHTARSP